MRRRVHARLQVEQAALDEQLHGGDGQPQPGGLHDRLGAGVDEEVLEELLEPVEPVGVHDPGDERVPAALTQLVEDRLRHPAPGRDVVAGPYRVAQLPGDGCIRVRRGRRGQHARGHAEPARPGPAPSTADAARSR